MLLIKIFIILMIINALVFAFIGNLHVCRITIGVSTIFYLLIVNFFRFPKRHIQVDDNTILCPADGKIVVIEETFEPEYLKSQCIQVSVFMNIFNVHINWYAINGIIKYFKYHKGRYMAAYLPKSSTENERTNTTAASGTGHPTATIRRRASWPSSLGSHSKLRGSAVTKTAV